jgi:hypothetical protein
MGISQTWSRRGMTLPGGHGFLEDEGVCRGVVEMLGREWGI